MGLDLFPSSDEEIVSPFPQNLVFDFFVESGCPQIIFV